MKPAVTVFVPCYNEEKAIGGLLESLREQTYPTDRMEVLLIDGHSTDQTLRKIDQFKKHNPDLDIKVIPNSHRRIPFALNIGCEAASHDILLRMDAHTIPAQNYVELCINGLVEKRGDNVGGKCNIVPANPSAFARAISIAAGHPAGSGGASYRSGSAAREVDTVAFGCYYKSTYQKVGPFDESLFANEDYEWNYRLRKSGGKIWFDPNIVCDYISRADLNSLGRQYFNYGYWKRIMLSKHPSSLRVRQALPVLLFLATIFASILLLVGIATSIGPIAWMGILIILAHPISILTTFLKERKDISILNAPLVIISIMTMHLSWGCGFLWSSIKNLAKKTP